MNWKRWKLGIVVALALSLLVAGSGVAAGCTWKVFVSVFCSAALTHLGAFLKDHPVEQVDLGGIGPAIANGQLPIAQAPGTGATAGN